jgi:tuberculosinol/isotuberculosinol synthase
VRVYGDTQRYLKGSPHEHVLAAYEELARRTAHHQRHRLFIGVFAHDAAETVAEIGASLYRELGRLPNKREIVEAYYGEYIEPADLFIGFDRPTVFDMPLIASGNESLYFTVAPSPYLDAQTLRAILYDHIYIRQVDDTAIDELTPEDWQALAEFYTLNRRSVLGIGDSFAKGHFWRPTPQVKLP